MHTAIQKGKIRSLAYLRNYLAPYKKNLAFVLLALSISSSSVLLIGKCLQIIIDNGLANGDISKLNQGFLMLFGVTIILAGATCVRYYLISSTGERIIADIRRDIFAHILKLSMDFYEHNRAGEILSRMGSDTTLLQNVIGSSLSVAMRNIITLIGGLVMLTFINSKLFALLGLVIPIVVIPIIAFGRRMREYARLSQQKSSDLSALTEEAIAGIHTIQAFTHERIEYKRFKAALSETITAALARIKARSILITLVISLTFGAVSAVLWVGSYDVINGNLTPGELSSFIFVSVLCAGSVGALTEVLGELQRAGGATERLVEFLHTKPTITNSAQCVRLSDTARGKISFKDVTFFYPSRPHKPVIEKFSLDITPGKITALVGESGAGKSTILQLMLRFYDIQAGNILFDNTPLKQIALESLRSQFAYVSQEPIIFSSTVWDNVTYGNSNASLEEVNAALQQAAAYDFVYKLPDGIHSYLGEKGVRLSTGQKQRLIIARAFLKNPKILLFDEATSALDSGNEKIVQQATEKLMLHRTTVIIAHRLSTIRKAHKIIVMMHGQIVEQGSHEELMLLKGEYYRLTHLQQDLVANC